MRSLILVLILGGLLKNHTMAQTMTVKQYIDSFKNIAMIEMLEYKVPASITLAQGLLESGSGNSRLAKQGNNHFGIKCKKDWTGCTILEDDDALQECFRCYSSVQESYKDHSRFLKENKRYAALFELEISDYRAWAAGLLKAGYATNQKYAELLIRTIEKNNLASFDTLILGGYNPYSKIVPANIDIVYNKVPSTVVQPNQTVASIAEGADKSERKLNRYNDLKYHGQIEPGDVLYLRPKKRKASVESHKVQEGETMWEISQKYAIKINTLYKKNLMVPGTEPKAGTIIQLQHKADSRPDTGRQITTETKEAIAEYHIVGEGETLYSISRLYGLTVEEMTALNNLTSSQISVGQKLLVTKGANTTGTNSTKIEHVVKIGDTLYSISRKYGVSVENIKKINNLQTDSLREGQILKIRL
ncbi:MAG: LysM peptidoglycan-binding domain-containing protein [Bacteroidia bacterium]|nr:LysM peptidoglycan-binding domain-containing protein [Bacteroidia bacterium]